MIPWHSTQYLRQRIHVRRFSSRHSFLNQDRASSSIRIFVVHNTKQSAHKACSCRSCKMQIKLTKEAEERRLRHIAKQGLKNIKLSADLDEPELDRIDDTDVVNSIGNLR